MKTEEANKIIAEYMGDCWHCIKVTDNFHMFCTKCGEGDPDLSLPEYVTSLDALVPVWEKLDLPKILEMDIRRGARPMFALRIYADLAYTQDEQSDTIQEAAAIATAKAIQELNK